LNGLLLLLLLWIRYHAISTTTSKATPPSTPPTIAPIATTLENVWIGLEESVPAAEAPDDVVEDAAKVLPLVLETGRVDIEGSLHPMTANESILNSALSLPFIALLKVKLCRPSTRFETE